MKPTNLAKRGWAMLSGTRLTIVCLGFLIALVAASQVATAWLAWDGSAAAPRVVNWLRLWGLTDLPRSPGFISVLGVLVLNLICGMLEGMPRLRAGPLAAGEEALRLGSELETRLSQDRFAVVARRWARKKLGRKPVVFQNTAGLELTVRRGHFAALLLPLAHLFLFCALAGAWQMSTRGFQARILVEEGAPVRAFELLRGMPPAEWTALEPRDKRLAGYYDADFGIATEGDNLRFYEDGKLAGSAAARAGAPFRYHGLTFHLLDYVPGSAQSVSLTVTESAGGTERSFASLSKGQWMRLEDFSFRVVEIQPQTDLNGPAVQVEYQESGHPPEQFWVFQDFPDYDFAHRRPRAQHFTLKAVRPHRVAELLAGREPGASLLWGGLTLMAFFFWAALMRPEERFWISWGAGGAGDDPAVRRKVVFRGWSRKRLIFEPRFYELANSLEHSIESAEAGDEPA